MEGADALNLVMARLGNRTDTAIRAAALLEMKLLQTRLEGGPTKPWFLFDRYASPDGGVTFFETTAGSGSLALPSTFLDLDEDEHMVYLFSTETGLTTSLSNVVARLERTTILNAELSVRAPGERAMPKAYAVIGQRIYFRPLADKAYIVQVPGYYATTAVDDSTAENLWLKWFPDLMIAGTVYEMATKHIRDNEIAVVAKADFDAATRRLSVENESRKHTAMRYVMGGYDR